MTISTLRISSSNLKSSGSRRVKSGVHRALTAGGRGSVPGQTDSHGAGEPMATESWGWLSNPAVQGPRGRRARVHDSQAPEWREMGHVGQSRGTDFPRYCPGCSGNAVQPLGSRGGSVDSGLSRAGQAESSILCTPGNHLSQQAPSVHDSGWWGWCSARRTRPGARMPRSHTSGCPWSHISGCPRSHRQDGPGREPGCPGPTYQMLRVRKQGRPAGIPGCP